LTEYVAYSIDYATPTLHHRIVTLLTYLLQLIDVWMPHLSPIVIVDCCCYISRSK